MKIDFGRITGNFDVTQSGKGCRQFASYRNRVGPERPLLKSVALLLEDAQHRNNSFSWIGEDELRRRGWDVEG